MKMKYSDAMQLLTVISEVKNRVKEEKVVDAKLFYALTKNEKMLISLAEHMNKLYTVAPEFQEFNRRRAEIANKYSAKNEDGTPKTIETPEGKMYDIAEDNKDTFKKEVDELRIEFKEVIDKQEAIETEMIIKLGHEIPPEEFTPYKMKIDNLQPDSITLEEMDKLFWIIEG